VHQRTAPFCIHPCTWVKVLSGFTRSLQGEINANEILLHISFQSRPVASCTGVKLLPSCPELPFHSAAQSLSVAKVVWGLPPLGIFSFIRLIRASETRAIVVAVSGEPSKLHDELLVP
jgi:hypothetical protein